MDTNVTEETLTPFPCTTCTERSLDECPCPEPQKWKKGFVAWLRGELAVSQSALKEYDLKVTNSEFESDKDAYRELVNNAMGETCAYKKVLEALGV